MVIAPSMPLWLVYGLWHQNLNLNLPCILAEYRIVHCAIAIAHCHIALPPRQFATYISQYSSAGTLSGPSAINRQLRVIRFLIHLIFLFASQLCCLKTTRHQILLLHLFTFQDQSKNCMPLCARPSSAPADTLSRNTTRPCIGCRASGLRPPARFRRRSSHREDLKQLALQAATRAKKRVHQHSCS